ncbi:MAG: OmpA family protein [Saprospiraceae bacterium]|nr:OmpA family protein [Saprospiraceae bacterium]MCB9345566.1 OmpA family protein [Lewinellaceae bacterium]
MIRKVILLLPLFFLALAWNSTAQTSSKSKSKERFRERDDRRYPVRLDNASILNLPGTDNSPAYYDNGIIFVTARAKRGPRDERTNEPFKEHYFSAFDALGKLLPPQKFEFNALKKSSFHEGAVCFSRDFKTVYMSRNNNKDGVIQASKDGRSTQKIYKAYYGFPDWTRPEELPFDSDDYSCMHPSLSTDGKRLYFASDMPGGFGGFDLYVVSKDKEGNWGKPINLGPNINTDKQELFPFISFSGTLFFSSNGRDSTLGGMDIYFANNPLNNPEEIVNLGEPFNSDGNDHGFIIDEDGHSGYFSSDRKDLGYGKDDIFQFFAPKGIEGTGLPETTSATISVIDQKTGEAIQGAEIRVLHPSDDGFISSSSDSTFYTLDLVQRQDDPNAYTMKLVRKGASELGVPTLLSNVEGKALTDFTRYKQYLIIVSAKGYTAREQFLFVDSDEDQRLNFKMVTEPPCLRAGGIVLTTGFSTRIANARIRFTHRTTGHTETVRTTWSGEFDACLPFDGEYIAYVERNGFKSENYRLEASSGQTAFNEIRLQPLADLASEEEVMPLANGLVEGSVLVLDKIFYEYNKTTLNQGAVRYLDAILDLMKRYPDMEIDLISHTDTRGDARLNMELTVERSKNAKTYLVYKGIDEKRINAIGKGETEPRNHCKEGVDCSDEEHQQNNRLEVKVRKLGLARS